MSAVTDYVSSSIDKAFPRKLVKMPLYGPDNIPSPHYGICFEDAETREDWCRCTVKKNYQPHTTEDVKQLTSIVADGFGLSSDQIDIKASWVTSKGHAVAVTPTKEYRREIANGDTIWPSLIVRAYYGGSFRATVAMKRDLCSNLQMMRNVDKTTVSLRHTLQFQDHFGETLDTFKNLICLSDNIVDAARKLNEITVSYDEFLDYLYPTPESGSKRSATTYQRKLDRIKQIHATEVDALGLKYRAGRGTLWQLVNAVTGFVQHDKSRNGKPSDDDRALLGVFDNESNRAWDRAFEIAGLAV